MDKRPRPWSLVSTVLCAIAGLAMAGYPIAWIMLSPKSLLRSTDVAFVNGFGAGFGFAGGFMLGVVLLGLSWHEFAGRLKPNTRRRIEIAALALVFVAAVIGTAMVTPR